MAEAIVGGIQPRTLLDAGCRGGSLVAELRRRDVDARGFNTSASAVAELSAEVQAFCRVGSVVEPLGRQVDLIVCLDVLEHLRADLIETAVANLARHTDTILFSCTPDAAVEQARPRPPSFWAGLFADHAFYRDHDFDASVVAPHALLLRRGRGSIVPLIRAYESRIERLDTELRELRAAAAADSRQDSPADAGFLARAAGRVARLLAVAVTTRGRAVPSEVRGSQVHGGAETIEAPSSRSGATAPSETAHTSPEPGHALESRLAIEGVTVQCKIEAPAADSGERVPAAWMEMSGWAVDVASCADAGIAEVQVYLDDAYKGTATYGLPRRDVGDYFGGARFADAGWRFALDLVGASSGTHEVQIRVRSSVSDASGTYSLLLNVQGLRSVTPRQRVALFVSGCFGDSMRYRCDHAVEQLGMLGVSATSVAYEKVAFGEVLDEYQVFVLHRVPYEADVAWFLEQAGARGKRVIFDTDDLVFDTDATRFVAGFEVMVEAQRQHFLNSVVRSPETLVHCDGVTVSTDPLREHARTLNDNVVVVPNVVSAEMLDEANAANRWHAKQPRAAADHDALTVAYLSGSSTHNRDFLEAADAVLDALEVYPHVRFLTVGPVALDDRFLRFGERVRRLPMQPWRRLPDVLASVDISLAPLEPLNPFTDSKSSIKFLEAGLMGVPTIASPRSDFVRVIHHGLNGFLADTPDEWSACLRRLVESDELRRRLGSRARDDVERSHSTRATAQALHKTLRTLCAAPDTATPLTINWLMGTLDQHAVHTSHRLLEIARGLGACRHQVRLCFDGDPAGPQRLLAEARGSAADLEICLDMQALPAADVSVATGFETAVRVAEHDLSLFKVLYMHELEPELNSDRLPSASEIEHVLDFPLRLVCGGEAVAERVRRSTRRTVDCLPAGPDQVRQLEHTLVQTCFVRLGSVGQMGFSAKLLG